MKNLINCSLLEVVDLFQTGTLALLPVVHFHSQNIKCILNWLLSFIFIDVFPLQEILSEHSQRNIHSRRKNGNLISSHLLKHLTLQHLLYWWSLFFLFTHHPLYQLFYILRYDALLGGESNFFIYCCLVGKVVSVSFERSDACVHLIQHTAWIRQNPPRLQISDSRDEFLLLMHSGAMYSGVPT